MTEQRPSASTVEYLKRLLAYQTPQVWRQLPHEESFREQVVQALVTHARWEANPPLGPDFFLLHLGQPWYEAFRTQRGLEEELAQALHWIGREAGLQFALLPLVKVAEPPLPSGELRIEAQYAELENLKGLAVPAPEEPVPPRAYLLIEGTRIFPLLRPLIHIGRRPDNDLVLSDPKVSRRHAQLRLYRGHFMLVDLDSTSGTMVNGRRIRRTVLYPGDRIAFAGVSATYGQRSTRPLGEVGPYAQSADLGDQSTLIIRRLKGTNGLTDPEEGS